MVGGSFLGAILEWLKVQLPRATGSSYKIKPPIPNDSLLIVPNNLPCISCLISRGDVHISADQMDQMEMLLVRYVCGILKKSLCCAQKKIADETRQTSAKLIHSLLKILHRFLLKFSQNEHPNIASSTKDAAVLPVDHAPAAAQ